MRRIYAILIALLPLCSCLERDIPQVGSRRGEDIQVFCRVPGFREVDVATKAIKSGRESQIFNMMMFICDSRGNVIAPPQYEESAKPIFSVIRSELGGRDEYKEESMIVVVANVTGDVRERLAGASTFDEIGGVSFSGCGIDIPDTGIPMIGTKVLNLVAPNPGENDPLAGSVIEIPLECLYAKVVFNISVVPTQLYEGKTQSFQLSDWVVYNVPRELAIGATGASEESAHADGEMNAPFVRTRSSKAVVNQSSGSDQLSFSFYMPEHKVNPTHGVTYPWGEDPEHRYDDYRQYLKPDFVRTVNEMTREEEEDRSATYVKVNGYFTDHNGERHAVHYDIYLGANNHDDFHVVRDHQYNNNVVIRGIKNSATAYESWVTYDHRVNVEQKEFDFNLQRETLLDCHWEIRPIRIRFNEIPGVKAGCKLRISLKDTKQTWLRMEMPSDSDISSARTTYCDAVSGDLAYGKRRYFTNTLVSSTLNANKYKSYTIEYDSSNPDREYTVWVYVDEYFDQSAADRSYPNPSYRSTAITCEFLDGSKVLQSQDYIFQQYNAFRVQERDGNGTLHVYYIEYFEEYLYNFDSRDNYDNVTDGMPWGYDGLPLSVKNGAVAMGDIAINAQGLISGTVETKVRDQWNKTVANQLKESKKYDFYLSRDVAAIENGSGLTARDRSGLEFTKEIYTNAGRDIKQLTTKDKPVSAVEYALNKNKRNADGSLTMSSIKWYMPAIDEIEEITSGGYDQFNVFQEKLYWSSQPSFKKYSVTFTGTYRSALNSTSGSAAATGAYFEDNTARARATNTVKNGDVRSNVTSTTITNGQEYIWGTMAFTHSFTVRWYLITSTITNEAFDSTPPVANDGRDAHYDEGNEPRSAVHRVRCVRAL